MKKAFLAISLATSIIGLGECSELTGMKEEPATYTQKEVNENALKVAKRILKNLDNKDVEKLNEDVDMFGAPFMKWSRDENDDLTTDSWDTDEFVNRYGNYDYTSNTELSLIPSTDWSEEFLDEKNRYQALVLAKYTGESSENISLVIPVIVEEDGSEFEADTIESFDEGYVSLIKMNAQQKYGGSIWERE